MKTGRPLNRKEYEILVHLAIDEAQEKIRRNPAERESILRGLRNDIDAIEAGYGDAREEQRRAFEEASYARRTGVRRTYAELMRLMRERVRELRARQRQTRLTLHPRERALIDEKAREFIARGHDPNLLDPDRPL
jgi:hypothetical protein